MNAIVVILLLTMAASALAGTAKPADDRPIVIYKAGQPFIFDGRRNLATQPVEKPAPVKPARAVG